MAVQREDKTSCFRLDIRSAPSEMRGRFLTTAKHGLKLSDEESELLWSSLPVELVLAGMAEADRERIAKSFRAMGIDVALQLTSFAHKGCTSHSLFAATGLCARCKERSTCSACTQLTAAGACPTCTKSLGRRRSFRNFRVAFLLAILALVVVTTWYDRRRIVSWSAPVTVGVYPINGDGSEQTQQYIDSLANDDFEDVARFMQREAERYQISTSPLVVMHRGPIVVELPPAPPVEGGALAVMQWSLGLRWWVFRAVSKYELGPAHVRIFAVYHEAKPGITLEHSLGLERGHVGIAHLFAGDQEAPANNVVIAHELLHTAGARDKYGDDWAPIHPQGFADPQKNPRYPQSFAEIMAGRIPISDKELKSPESLEQCVVGLATAEEIQWSRGNE